MDNINLKESNRITMKMTAVVLTKNEEKNIKRCLRSLDFCDEIIIIDDYSTDNTLNQVLKTLPDGKHSRWQNSKIKIYKKKLTDFAQQRNFGQRKATGDWVLFIDADEEISSELKNELVEFKRKDSDKEIIAYYIKRRDFFWGRELKHGEIKKIRRKGLIRLVKKEVGIWEGKVHESLKLKVQSSKLKTFKSFINHYPHQTIKDFLKTINFYSTLRAKELYDFGIKTNVFQLIFYPLGKFLLTYFVYLGFLDGPAGFVYSFMMSFHSFLVRAKLFQYYAKNAKND